ncbi:MAG: phosphotransferase [Oscillospiraceae bacterium]
MAKQYDAVLAERPQKTIYRDGDTVLKVFESSFSKANILAEALNQARVEETGLRIPRLLEVMMIDGKWAIRTEFIAGKTLQQLMTEHPENMDAYLEQFVALQMEVHSKEAPLLNKLKDKMNRKIGESTFNATTRYELHTRLESMPKHKKVCHGDFNPSNIIVTPGGEMYILDWSHATQGNAAADVARTYLLFCLANAQELADKYLDLFCKMTDTAKQYIQSWMPIVAASQSVKGNENEHAMLKRWVNVVDYE